MSLFYAKVPVSFASTTLGRIVALSTTAAVAPWTLSFGPYASRLRAFVSTASTRISA